jgi:hypothetical protein
MKAVSLTALTTGITKNDEKEEKDTEEEKKETLQVGMPSF